MRPRNIVALVIAGAGILGLQLFLFPAWPWLVMALNAPLVFVSLVSMQTHWRWGVVVGLGLGWVWHFFSVLPPIIYPLSFAAAALVAWMARRRLFVSRTGINIQVAVLMATVVFYGLATAMLYAYHVFRSASIVPLVSTWVAAIIWQLLVHPVVAGSWWLVSGQRRSALRIIG